MAEKSNKRCTNVKISLEEILVSLNSHFTFGTFIKDIHNNISHEQLTKKVLTGG